MSQLHEAEEHSTAGPAQVTSLGSPGWNGQAITAAVLSLTGCLTPWQSLVARLAEVVREARTWADRGAGSPPRST